MQLFLAISVLTILMSASFGLLVDASIPRSIAVGFYLVGCFVLLGAFFFGNRGPVRPLEMKTQAACSASARAGCAGRPGRARGGDQGASGLLPLGVVLILLGIAWDTKHSLF